MEIINSGELINLLAVLAVAAAVAGFMAGLLGVVHNRALGPPQHLDKYFVSWDCCS